MSYRWTLGLLLLGAGCASSKTGMEVDALMTQTFAAYQLRQGQGDVVEAHQLAWAVSRVDPEYPGIAAAMEGLPPDIEDVLEKPLMGSNVAVRAPDPAPWWGRILWYVPDRLLDAVDIFSFDVHLGFGFWVDVHVTRAIQVALGFRVVGGFGWHDHRSLGLQSQTQATANAVVLGAESYSAYLAGTSGWRGGSWGVAGLPLTSDALYQEYKDYWAIGAGVTGGVAGVEFDVHLAQIVDFLVGWLTFDPLNDDFAKTTGLDLSEHEKNLIKSLSQAAADEGSVKNYEDYKATKAATQTPAPAPASTPAAPATAPAETKPTQP